MWKLMHKQEENLIIIYQGIKQYSMSATDIWLIKYKRKIWEPQKGIVIGFDLKTKCFGKDDWEQLLWRGRWYKTAALPHKP